MHAWLLYFSDKSTHHHNIHYNIHFQVNISPSLHTSAPLDKHIKSGLIKDLFNIAGFQVPSLPSRSKSTAPSSQQGSAGARAANHPGGGSKNSGTTPARGVAVGSKHGSGTSEGGNNDNLEQVTDSQLYFNPG